MGTTRELLGKVEPFRRLPEAELDILASLSTEVSHPKGTHVFHEGDDASGIFLLKSGRLEIVKFNSEGRPRAIETISSGELFGTLCRLNGGNKGTFPCTAVAGVDSHSIRIPESVFWNLYRRYPSMVEGICGLCSDRLHEIQALSFANHEPVEKRIARTLLSLAKKHGNILDLTRREISELSATTVETAIRTLAKFRERKLVSSERGRIVLEDLPRIAAILER